MEKIQTIRKTTCCSCTDPESFVRWDPTLTGFFSVDEGREFSNIKMAYRWLTDGGLTLNAGLVAL